MAGLTLGMGSEAVADTQATTPPAPAGNDKETLISAQRMRSDDKTNTVTAMGNVEIVRGPYVLHADQVTYNKVTGVMIAEGHVAFMLPDGEVEFAQHEEVTGDMKQAFAENVGILFPDNSRLSAATARRYGDRYMLAEKAAYTSCNVCAADPSQPPTWQAKAETITHDNETHDIYYHNATLEMAGVPVAYSPYFSTPDPTVKRRTGFLSPTPGLSPNIGTFIKTPYYIDISNESDATLTPTFSQNDDVQFAGEYRRRFENGSAVFSGSVAQTNLVSDADRTLMGQWRGHVFNTTRYDIDDTWRAGTDVAFTSDKSYLQRYNISSTDTLKNRAFIEGFQGRDYAVVNSYYFQDLRPSVTAVQPFVLPSASFEAFGEPGKAWGGRWSFSGNTLMTQRGNANQLITNQGPNSRRLSLNGGWDRQIISTTGFVTDLSGLLRGDAWYADNIVDTTANSGAGSITNNFLATRQFEEATIMERYPIASYSHGVEQTIEPIAAFTAAPVVKNPTLLPNEDSLDVEFDESNLFSPNRYSGSDRIEGGSRATYGLRHALVSGSAHTNIFGGASYALNPDHSFPLQSGLSRHASDYVGRVDITPGDWFTANYGFRLDQRTLEPQRQEASASAGVAAFRPNVSYTQAYNVTDPNSTVAQQIRQATVGFSSALTKFWSISTVYVHSFDPQPGPRSTTLNLNYADECTVFGVSMARSDTSRVGLSAGTSVLFHLFFRNLGGIHTDTYSAPTYPESFRKPADANTQ